MVDPIMSPLETRKGIVALLLQLKKVDGIEKESELGYIFHVALQLGLSEEDVYEISDNVQEYPLVPPKEERERIIILYYLLFFMNADGVILEEEEQLVHEFEFRLGFRPALTNDLINVLKGHVKEAVPPEKLLEKIRTYLN